MMAGITPPPVGEMKDNNGKPIYFDSVDNSAYILGKAQHSARRSWIYVNGEYLNAIRADIAGDPNDPALSIAWKFMWTAKESWLGPTQNLGSVPAVYNLTMDPYEKYDMIFNGAAPTRGTTTSPGRYAGEDNGWASALMGAVLLEFDRSIVDYPSIQRSPGGASNDNIPDLQHPKNPLPLMDLKHMPQVIPSAD